MAGIDGRHRGLPAKERQELGFSRPLAPEAVFVADLFSFPECGTLFKILEQPARGVLSKVVSEFRGSQRAGLLFIGPIKDMSCLLSRS